MDLKREEFLEQLEGIILPETFDQDLLDQAAEMFGKWGKGSHLSELEHLFGSFGLAAKPEDTPDIEIQKAALRYVCSRMSQAGFSRKDASDLIRNFNRIKDPGYKWLE
ncbi:MAG: hypothetical protein ACP5OU_06790 [Methanothrix sp.]